MDSSRHREWEHFRNLRRAFPDEAERGRLLAAHQIATDPEARKRVEDTFGVELARQQYPEAYRYTGRFGGIVRALDRVRDAIPW